MKFELHCGDAIDFLSQLPSESVDLVNSDYAYESIEKHRKRGTTTRLKKSKASSNAWFGVFPDARVPELMRHLFRVLRPDRHCYLWCDVETMFVLKPAAEEVGFRFWKPLIWDKMRIGMGYHYRNQLERILFFEKGRRRLADLSIPDILRCPPVRGGYPAEKPVEVHEVLTMQSALEDELVLDPFMGSGSAGEAALRLGCRFLGNDINPDAVESAQERLGACRELPAPGPHRRIGQRQRSEK